LKLIFFAHPNFLSHQSMPRYATMLAEGMNERGHEVEIWAPKSIFHRLSPHTKLKKWLGYLDQYILFPLDIRSRINAAPDSTLFVFTDHALGPWVPLVSGRHHVIHCHDFLAQRSAFDEIPENKIGWTGKKYQQYIRKGFQKGKHFISVSKQTQSELQRFLATEPASSNVVYNGLNQHFKVIDKEEARQEVSIATGLSLAGGYILHVGGNHFYKNRQGVIAIYNEWRNKFPDITNLLMIGEKADADLQTAYESSPFRSSIHLLSGIDDSLLKIAYAGARVMLFPSIAEGFGWPIAEAMASGTPVITTSEAPMTEVAGNAAMFIPRKPVDSKKTKEWATACSEVLNDVMSMDHDEYTSLVNVGLENAKRFARSTMMRELEVIYESILNQEIHHPN
jgi:glycosyltransferase involved in cell wall biosynthesis